MTDPVVPAAEADAVLSESLESQGTLHVVRDPKNAAAHSSPSRCHEDIDCIRTWGSEKNASHVAHVRLAGLGSTVVIRARLVDLAVDTREQTQEEVVQHATPARIRNALSRLGLALAPKPAETISKRTWYESWWLWTAVGTVVVGGVAAILLLDGNEQEPDFVITPP